MLVAKIWLDNPEDTTSIKSEDLFPYSDDLLYETLKKTLPNHIEPAHDGMVIHI